MKKFKERLRDYLWNVLGVSKSHATLVMGSRYLKEDTSTELGYGSYVNRAKLLKWGGVGVKIGKYSSIADDVTFIVDDGSHQYNPISTYPFPSNRICENKGITIGNDVWIGANATILYGVTIGDGAIIAAGAVVVKDVEPYCIVGGVPAQTIKRRCSPKEARQIQAIAWWNWERSIIESRLEDFRLTFRDFIEKYHK